MAIYHSCQNFECSGKSVTDLSSVPGTSDIIDIPHSPFSFAVAISNMKDREISGKPQNL